MAARPAAASSTKAAGPLDSQQGTESKAGQAAVVVLVAGHACVEQPNLPCCDTCNLAPGGSADRGCGRLLSGTARGRDGDNLRRPVPTEDGEQLMVIVSGHLAVEALQRESYRADRVGALKRARWATR